MSVVIRKMIYTAAAPAAIGPFSQAVVVDRTMYISGQLGMDVASGQLVAGGVQAQAKQALINMGEILKAAGCGYENIFSQHLPARAAYQVAALPRGGLVEIEAVAVLGPITDASLPYDQRMHNKL
ncbi:2-iminobutanoate/2-iminopropanoate deaminase-like isoform X2 [Myxocyprinus asiaticus]|uniref:2-iminobutanoate/2-iminopropanoate deaminase-like isoform X2 n=1 Tax=Myxocyprinus asiaticus TaxID=70543 RepID=UPI0022214930|nr:2-iminobutanoate/2-iminopropanoate deaminase-like isoform X2 [Myxocyprinus asiaticus]